MEGMIPMSKKRPSGDVDAVRESPLPFELPAIMIVKVPIVPNEPTVRVEDDNWGGD